MLFEDRISLILKVIEQNGSIENSKIIKDLKISEARGGAILKRVARKDIAIREKNSNKDSKKKIAKLAAQFISNGDYIYLDAGTTTYEIIDYMKGKDIKVVTNGIIHLEKLVDNDIEKALIKRQAINNSNKAFILADSSKFDIVYFANVARLEEATIITDKKEVNKNIIKHTKIINDWNNYFSWKEVI